MPRMDLSEHLHLGRGKKESEEARKGVVRKGRGEPRVNSVMGVEGETALPLDSEHLSYLKIGLV